MATSERIEEGLTDSSLESQAAAGSLSVPVTVIRAASGWRFLDLREVWAYRELLYFLTWRDIKIRYKQTVLGGLWAVLQPLLLMVVFSVVFGNMAKVSSEGVPYPIFAFAALVPWILFSQSLSAASGSLVSSSSLITKVYFPRIIVPLASAGSFLVDFLINFIILICMMFYYGIDPSLGLLWVPFLTLLTLLAALAGGIWLSALNVRYRDVRYAVPFLIQLLLFASPVAYSATELNPGWRLLFALNPVTGIAEGFRWALLRTDTRPESLIAVSTLAVLVVLVAGLTYFRSTEQTFADVI